MAYDSQDGNLEKIEKKVYARSYKPDRPKPHIYICPADPQAEGSLEELRREQHNVEFLNAAGLNGMILSEGASGESTFKVGGEFWLHHCKTRRRNAISNATEKSYHSYLKRLKPLIGNVPLAHVTNKIVKDVVESLSSEGLSSKTIREIVAVIKYVVASVLDENGEQIYPRKWNHDFIDMPVIKKQNQPTFTSEQVENIVSTANERESVLFALLAGTGMRIGEALAIEIGLATSNLHNHDGHPTGDATVLSADCRTIYIRKSVWNGHKQEPKTESAKREIDLCDELAAFVKAYVGDRQSGFLFCSRSGKPLLQRNVLRDSLHRILLGREALQSYRTVNAKKVKHVLFPALAGVTGKKMGFHAFRRFRVTHLRTEAVPEDFTQFWIGHKDGDITSRYSKMKDRVTLRKEWAEEVGLGFKLPAEKVTDVIGQTKERKKRAA
jgi:integrase